MLFSLYLAPSFVAGLGFAVLASANTVLVPLPPSHPKRIATASSTPSHSVTLHYTESTSSLGAHYVAVLDWNFTSPALIFKDIPDVSSYSCIGTSDAATFSTDAAFQVALKWTLPLVVILEGDAVGCTSTTGGDEKFQPALLQSILSSNASSRTIAFESRATDWKSLSTYLHVNIVRQSAAAVRHRNFNKRLTYDKPFSSAWNYDTSTESTTEKRIPLFTEEGLTASCFDCYVTGEWEFKAVNIEFNPLGAIAGDLVTGYVEFSGGLEANFAVELDLEGTLEKTFTQQLADIPLSPLDIPGTIIIGPSLEIDASMDVSVSGNATLIAGINVKWEGVDLIHTFGGGAQSTQSIPDPVVTQVGPKLRVVELSESVGTYIEPHLIIGVSLFPYDDNPFQVAAVDLGVKGKSTGLVNNATEGGSQCPDGIYYQLTHAPTVVTLGFDLLSISDTPTTLGTFAGEQLYSHCFNI